MGLQGQRLSPELFVDGLRRTWACCCLESALSAHLHPQLTLCPTLSLVPHLIVLDTLQGELVTVHPQRIAKDGQSIKLLQLESLRGGDGMEVRSEEGLAGSGQTGPHSATLALTSHTPPPPAESQIQRKCPSWRIPTPTFVPAPEASGSCPHPSSSLHHMLEKKPLGIVVRGELDLES